MWNFSDPSRPSLRLIEVRPSHDPRAARHRCRRVTLGASLLILAQVWLTLVGCGKVQSQLAAQTQSGTGAKAATTSVSASGPDHAATLTGVMLAYDTVLQNLANAQIPGYQAVRPIFESADGSDLSVSRGVMRPVMYRDPSPGRPTATGRWLDVAIEGNGYFIVDDPEAGGVDGLAYSRAGRMYVNRDGALVLGSFDGPRLEPTVVFPDSYRDIKIEPTGVIYVLPEATASWVAVGQLHLARFANASGLSLSVTGHYVATGESGPPLVDLPGGLGLGSLKYKHLEGSNVDLVAELQELRQLKDWGLALCGALGIEPQFAAEPATAAQWAGASHVSNPPVAPRPLAEVDTTPSAW